MKKFACLIFVLFYTLAVMLSLLIAVKPGAAIFFYKTTLNMDNCVLEDGFAYRCPVNLSPIIFPPNRVLLFEDGQQLYPDSRHQVGLVGDGCFNAKVTKSSGYNIFFAPFGNSNPLKNAKTYRAYFAYSFFSHTMGILYLSLLLPGLLGFFRFAFGHVKAWKDPRRLPQEVLQSVALYLAQKRALIAGIRSSENLDWRTYFLTWGKLCVDTVMAAYGAVFIEWIFQVTGNSFLTEVNLGQKLGAFFLTALFLTGLALALIAALLALSLVLRLVRLAWAAFVIAQLVPTTLWVAMMVLMIDNFTYVIFHFGILTSTGLGRIAYGILFGVIFLSLYWKRLTSSGPGSRDKQFAGDFRWLSGIAIGLVCISLVTAMLGFAPVLSTTFSVDKLDTSTLNRPNIILIGSDGVSAKHMSVYGYERDTTPNLRALGRTSLVAENTFANASSTLGSIASIFTSKLPTQTRVIYPPDVLKGADAFEHLPGFLSAAGYTTVEIGVQHYVDAYAMNVQNGFDVVNQRSIQNDPLIKAWRDVGYGVSAQFIYTLEEKLADRFLQAFYLDSVANPFDLVTKPVGWLEDHKRMDQLLTLLSQNKGPVFAHVHLMGTHGGRFFIEEPKYSLGQEQYNKWLVDFYDDSILAFDRYIGELIKYLKTNGQYDHTLLIIYSDHPMNWNIRERIPLILHFPGDQNAGVITYDTQHLDIAPTILDYMGQEVPAWMAGRSLLSGNPGTVRMIYSAARKDVTQDNTDLGHDEGHRGGPPFYQFDAIQVAVCDHWYELDLWTRVWQSGLVDRHTAPCVESDLPSKDEVVQSIIELLASQGYDVSSLR